MMEHCFLFFFSSRRRHTRYIGDWSSDVCSSDLAACPGAGACGGQYTANTMALALEFLGLSPLGTASVPATHPLKDEVGFHCGQLVMRSEERRVGKEDRSRWSTYRNDKAECTGHHAQT